MTFIYTIHDLSSKSNVSIQSCYGLIKKNKAFIDENSIRRQRKIYYNQAVMDFFISYYSPPSADKIDNGAERPEKSTLESLSADTPHENQSDANKTEIAALKAEIAALKTQLELKEAERQQLFNQNSALLLIIQQEKQEKMLLLPAAKKPFSAKIKEFFNHKQ